MVLWFLGGGLSLEGFEVGILRFEVDNFGLEICC